MNAKTMMTTAAAMMISAALEAAVTVTNISVRQHWPWNGKVDIDYEILSAVSNATFFVYPKGTDGRLATPVTMRTVTGDGYNNAVGVGKHRMVWDAKADMPGFHTSDFKVTLQVISSGAQYLVVDLSAGTNAVTYPIRYSNVGPDITDAKCRTTELWLRLVMPGTFMMGTTYGTSVYNFVYEQDEQPHHVTLTRPYYIGIFEITQRQWMLMGGDANCIEYTGACRPIDSVSYTQLRGGVIGAQWPNGCAVDADSFLGCLRQRTALAFDLPTEGQWEYACRAGTSSDFYNGVNPNYHSEYGRMYGVEGIAGIARVGMLRSDGRGGYSEHTVVGKYDPNAFGLYDMHGNVAEWCRDAYEKIMSASPAVDPVGGVETTSRVCKGGSWKSEIGNGEDDGHNVKDLRSSARWPVNAGETQSGTLGFRLVCIPVE